MTQIGLLGEFARRDAVQNADAKVHVQRICDTARELAQTLDEIVWMVNPRNDLLNKLGLYMAAYAEGFFDATPVRSGSIFLRDFQPIRSRRSAGTIYF